MQKDKEKIFYQVLLLIAAVLLVFLFYRSQEKNPVTNANPKLSENQAISVDATLIVGKDQTLRKKYVGYVTPINEIEIVPYISGFIEQINVLSGQEVNVGQSLIRIKQEEYRAKKDAANAALLKAKATLDNAKIYFERMEKAGEKALSKTEIDNARAAYLEAVAAYSGAQADLATAEVTLGYTDITSSIFGTVGYVDLSIGDYVSPNKTLFRIIQFDPIRVVFAISDNDYLSEKNKNELFSDEIIKLELSNGTIYDEDGHFVFTDNRFDAATNSLAVYADFANPNKKLIANSYVDVIVEKTLKNTVSVEKKLLYMQPDGNFVYVIRNGRATLQKVNIEADEGSSYIVRNDFSDGDMLVNEVNNNIKEGTSLIAKTPVITAVKEDK